ncbi:MAG: iron-siderophore ABC transporter substrate-binding protein [Clostridiales bacterium]|nr:iron-siderophore ABC transporter substrate-binding protein [Clostridiales bacterium]
MKKPLAILLAFALSCALLASCAQNSASQNPTPDAASSESPSAALTTEDTGYPIVVAHAYGETVIESKPQRVVAIGWANQDTPLALGVVPVGMSEANYGVLDGGNLLPWTKAKLDELGGAESCVVFNDTDGYDFEAINECEPDVIIAASSGITQEEYDTLSSIAPTIAYPEKPWQILWREQVRMNSKAIGLEAEGEALISDLDALIAGAVAKYPVLDGKTAAFVYFDPTNLSTISIYTAGDTRAAFLVDLGLEVAPSVRELEKGSDSFYLTISAENADKLSDIDVLLTWASGDGEDLLAALQADPLTGSIPAVKNGAIVMFSESPLAAAQSPSALSIPYTIDEYVAKIAEAAEKIR